ncbi:MAG: cyclic-di-AMP receptor [Chloroflexota bacterium]
MKLVTVVAQQDDAAALTEALRQADYRSTRLDTAGGFLRRGNATLLVGVEAEQVADVVRIVQDICRPRTVTPTAEPVQTGAATVFVLDVARFERL